MWARCQRIVTRAGLPAAAAAAAAAIQEPRRSEPAPSKSGSAPSSGPDRWVAGPKLGEGAFACVRLCRDRRTGQQAALKEIDKSGTSDSAFRREVVIMRQVGAHPFIIEMLDAYEQETKYGLVLELASGGEVFDRICEQGTFSERRVAKLIRSLALALAHMHARDVVHRDLKPENLLLVDEAPDSDLKARSAEIRPRSGRDRKAAMSSAAETSRGWA